MNPLNWVLFISISHFQHLTFDFFFVGIDQIKKSHFVKKIDKETKEYYYSEITGGFSKNHRDDDEGSRNGKGGTIPFAQSENGFNPGKFIEQVSSYMTDIEFMFQRPRRKSKDFDIHNLETTTYFEKSKVGVHLVWDMMPKVSINLLSLVEMLQILWYRVIFKA